ncbi:uncharacterized protein LOC133288435 isoform X2 [Gastrolobium bilobum]|nr:uncharacterized protein LOC133288435 isoform X2 [Gastrolobium bilobum]
MEKGDIIAANATKKDPKKETSKRKSNLNANCEVKGKRNLGQQGGNSNDISQKKKMKKKGDRSSGRVQRSSIKKGQNLEDLSHGSYDVHPDQASSLDDVDLTIEDLMAIAEQYVRDYENTEQQETSGRQCKSKWQFPAITEAGTTLDSPCENKKSSSSRREALYSSTPTTTGELIATSSSQTGHPAQDMLDLFLGPLLRKTLEKEEKRKSTVESLEITHEFNRLSQDENVGEEMVPLMKKRNTLKDKVAMFLD